MKKFWILMVLAAFLMAAPVAQVAFAKKGASKVNCCVKGKCSKMTKADCTKANGKVVKSCKACK